MTPVEFYRAPAAALDNLSFVAAEICPPFLKQPNQAAFRSPADIRSFCCYRVDGTRLLLASPFGAIELPLENMDESLPVELHALSQDNQLASWKISLSSSWADRRGAPLGDPSQLMRPRLVGGVKIPVHDVHHMRAQGRGLLQWATVILPAKPESIARSEAGVDIVAGGQSFMLPAGPAADLVLANKARWGLPQADGSFALSPMPR